MTACTEVSTDGLSPLGFMPSMTKAVAFSARASALASASSSGASATGTMMSRASASASQVPDALIQSTPSRFSDVFPPAAWVRSGSRPSSRRQGKEGAEFGLGE